MYMSPSDFEKHLQAFRPAAPSAKVGRVVEVELTQIPEGTPTSGILPASEENSRLHRLLSGFFWAAGGAAAAIIVAAGVNEVRHPSKVAAPVAAAADEASYFEQTETERELLSAVASDVVYDDDEQPAQVVSYSSLERYTWTNPKTGARVEVEVPRRDVVLVPLAFQ
jgi:hypothetical protein